MSVLGACLRLVIGCFCTYCILPTCPQVVPDVAAGFNVPDFYATSFGTPLAQREEAAPAAATKQPELVSGRQIREHKQGHF